jgi:hypothetical protein
MFVILLASPTPCVLIDLQHPGAAELNQIQFLTMFVPYIKCCRFPVILFLTSS